MTNTNIWDLQVALRMGLEAEALNGEGSVGNVSLARKIKLTDELMHAAFTGSMASHTFLNKVYELTDAEDMCEACRLKSPIRLGDLDPDKVKEELSASGNHVNQCVICDLAGFMSASKDFTAKRTKPASFSAGLAVEATPAQIINRSRVDQSEAGGVKRDKDADRSDVSTQMIMQQEVRSNVYALTVRLNLGRVGFDDERLRYVTDDVEELTKRIKISLTALRNMLLDMEGAKMSTMAPHLTSLEGVVTQRTNPTEVLSGYSPLKDDYKEQHAFMNPHAVEFGSPKEVVEVFQELMDEENIRTMVKRNLKHTGQIGEEE